MLLVWDMRRPMSMTAAGCDFTVDMLGPVRFRAMVAGAGLRGIEGRVRHGTGWRGVQR